MPLTLILVGMALFAGCASPGTHAQASAAAAPAGAIVSGSLAANAAPYLVRGNPWLGTRASWAATPAAASFEVKVTLTDSDDAIDGAGWAPAEPQGQTGQVLTLPLSLPASPVRIIFPTAANFLDLYSDSPAAGGFVRVRPIGQDGTAGAWYRLGLTLEAAPAAVALEVAEFVAMVFEAIGPDAAAADDPDETEEAELALVGQDGGA